jgi:hypothetical protein
MSPRYSRLNDRLNPVLVKEVRQAVRGRFFRTSFMMMLMVAGTIAAFVLANLDLQRASSLAQSGPRFFFGMHAVFVVAAFLIVPQHASRTMSSERDGRTFDALVISGLRPAQIILGKWLAAGMLLLLFLSAFAPFLVVGFTLFGLDMVLSLTLLAFTLMFSMGLSLIGILAASVARKKSSVTMMAGIFTIACLIALATWLSFGGIVLFESGGSLRGQDLFFGLAVALVSLFLLYLWIYGLAVSTITHQEENGMLRVRIACCLASLFLILTTWLVFWSFPSPEVLTSLVGMAYVIVTLLNIPILTESDRLGVRCVHQIRAGQWRKPFLWMFLPSGATAFPLYLAQLALVSLPLLTPERFFTSGSGFPSTTSLSLFDAGLPGTFATLFVCLTLVSIPTSLAASPRTSSAKRNAWRVFIPLSPFLLAFASAIFGLLIEDRDLSSFRSGLNPFWFIAQSIDRKNLYSSFNAWLILAALSVLVQFNHARFQRKKIRQLYRQAVLELRTQKLSDQASADSPEPPAST